MRSVNILGVRVDDVTYDESVALIEQFIVEGGPHLVSTPNPEIVMEARRDPEYRALLNRSALAVPDGIGLMYAACWLRQPLREHVRGTDLVQMLAAQSVSRGWRWYLLGAAEGVAEEAARALQSQYPGLRIAGASGGSPRRQDDVLVRRTIKSAGPVDLILVAYGAPRQERWLERNLAPLEIPVGIGVGGVLNYLAGRVPRAPKWLRDLELEFLHRLITQPWRWRRQLALPRFALLAARAALKQELAVRTKGRV